MIRLSRAAISFFALAFGLYHPVLGFLNFDSYRNSSLVVIAISLYVLALLLTVLDYPGIRLKPAIASINVGVAIVIPLLMAGAINLEDSASNSTWHVAGIATLMAITAVRQHQLLAWIGVVAMVLETLSWGGFGVLFSAGIFGATMLVAAAQAASQTISSSDKAAIDYRDQALATAAATAAQTAARVVRKARLEQALEGARPFLEKIVESDGRLTQAEKREALTLESVLRDQIRARHFDSRMLQLEVLVARRRGVVVQLLDDGGLEELGEVQRNQILEQVARYLSEIRSGKVVIRSSANESWTVSIIASQPDSEKPDLFVRL